MSAWWSGSVAAFRAADPRSIVAALAERHIRHHRASEVQQLRAWETTVMLLRDALADAPGVWRLLLEYPLLRLARRIDAVLLTDRAILVLEVKDSPGLIDNAARVQVEDYALDLQDFHAGSRGHPIVPVVVAPDGVPRPASWPLPIAGVAEVQEASRATLPTLLRDLARSFASAPPLDIASWEHAPYRPVPTIVEAACTLYARHGVEEIASARSDVASLGRTTAAIRAALREAESRRRRVALFVTGIPGAGKTLCGLNAAFSGEGAVFLTGNPTLVHVLREALARDAAAASRTSLRAARQRVESAIQALPHFRDLYITKPNETPAERIAVVDEAQRCWARGHAERKTRDRPARLTDSEPALLLDIMARHAGWSAMVCLIGGGQEIHTGEGGLAEWGEALRARPEWDVLAAPAALASDDPRQRLPELPGLRLAPDLHLDVPVRCIPGTAAAPWVDAVLRGDAASARRIAQEAGGVPFALTRSLEALRRALRETRRGTRRAGLVASSGAARLRADGLGAELPHMDAQAVARWFLDRWPDVRASDALEVVATEFSMQGLELDHVGLCWGGDMIRAGGAWRVRDFRGTDWTLPRGAEAIANRINTYRVLLTRARHRTILWVPPGDPDDRTRPPAEFDAITRFLLDCGAAPLAPAATIPERRAEAALL